MTTFRFGDFELDVAACELRRAGQPLPLERRPMDLLILLVERRQALVSRDEIVKRLWGERAFVDVEMGVNTAIRKVRQVLGTPTRPTFIQTLPARGYRFLPKVELVEPVQAAEAVARVRLAVLPFENLSADPRRSTLPTGSPKRRSCPWGRSIPST